MLNKLILLIIFLREKEKNMSFNLHKMLKSFLLAAILLPAIAFANTEFKGTETVNINRADAATLAAYLKGVGVNKAKDIVAYRKSNGKFKSIEDLKNVPGIGDETFKDNKRKLSTSRGKSVAPEGFKLGKSSGKPRRTSKSTSKKSSTKRSTSRSKSAASSKDGKSTSKAKKTKTTTKKKATSSKSKSSSKKSSSKSSTAKKKTSTKTKMKKPKKTTKKTTSKKRKTKKKKK